MQRETEALELKRDYDAELKRQELKAKQEAHAQKLFAASHQNRHEAAEEEDAWVPQRRQTRQEEHTMSTH